MELKDLLSFIAEEEERLRQRYASSDEEKRILRRTVKLMEELGELSNDIMKALSLQRGEKLKGFTKEDLAEEFADVLIVALILAKTLDVDIEEALEKKMRKIEARYTSK